MSDRMLVATRKGLIIVRAQERRLVASPRTDFAGVPVTAALRDRARRRALCRAQARPFRLQAASLRRRRQHPGRRSPAPAFPADAAGRAVAVPDLDARRPAAPTQPGTAVGRRACRPGCSAPTTAARAGSWCSALWDVPEREKWFGGGYDDAGIHSVSPDPRDPDRVVGRDLLRRRLGHARRRRELDAARRGAGRGLYAARAGRHDARRQDPHRVARCAAAPDVMWMQHHYGIFRSTDAGATLDAAQAAGRRFRLRRRGASARTRSTAWFVPGDQGRDAHAARRRARRHAHAATAARPGRRLREGLPQRTPTT